jgi:hypothetical protein
MYQLPNHIQTLIYKYDNTYHNQFEYVLNQLKYNYIQYNQCVYNYNDFAEFILLHINYKKSLSR